MSVLVIVRSTSRPRLAAVARTLHRERVGSTTVLREGRLVTYPRFAWEGVVATATSYTEARAIASVWTSRGATARFEELEALP